MTEIRALDDADLDAVVALSLRAWAPVFASFATVLGPAVYGRAYPDWTTSQAQAVRDVCATEDVVVAEVEGRLAGFAAMVIRDDTPRTAQIDMIAVDPICQRQGVASALLEYCQDHLRAAGVVLADIGTGGDPGHAPARRLYEKAGFTALPLVRYYKVF